MLAIMIIKADILSPHCIFVNFILFCNYKALNATHFLILRFRGSFIYVIKYKLFLGFTSHWLCTLWKHSRSEHTYKKKLDLNTWNIGWYLSNGVSHRELVSKLFIFVHKMQIWNDTLPNSAVIIFTTYYYFIISVRSPVWSRSEYLVINGNIPTSFSYKYYYLLYGKSNPTLDFFMLGYSYADILRFTLKIIYTRLPK